MIGIGGDLDISFISFRCISTYSQFVFEETGPGSYIRKPSPLLPVSHFFFFLISLFGLFHHLYLSVSSSSSCRLFPLFWAGRDQYSVWPKKRRKGGSDFEEQTWSFDRHTVLQARSLWSGARAQLAPDATVEVHTHTIKRSLRQMCVCSDCVMEAGIFSSGGGLNWRI